MHHLIQLALAKGGTLHGSISGGKDGQAMVKTMVDNGYQFTSLVHADLGRVEWPESLPQCRKLADEINTPLHIVTRSDNADLIDRMYHRMDQLKGTGKPFWPDNARRYCTSQMKREPIDKYLRTCGTGIVISCEGIRGDESTERSYYVPLEIRPKVTSSYYDGMTVEEAINAHIPGKRLALTYYPIFGYTLEQVWNTYGMSLAQVHLARETYRYTKIVPAWWPFHPAYAYGNTRVSCMFCIMGKLNDLQVAAEHNPDLLNKMIEMESEGNATFKYGWSLKKLTLPEPQLSLF